MCEFSVLKTIPHNTGIWHYSSSVRIETEPILLSEIIEGALVHKFYILKQISNFSPGVI